jgi:hypothetical protein
MPRHSGDPRTDGRAIYHHMRDKEDPGATHDWGQDDERIEAYCARCRVTVHMTQTRQLLFRDPRTKTLTENMPTCPPQRPLAEVQP